MHTSEFSISDFENVHLRTLHTETLRAVCWKSLLAYLWKTTHLWCSLSPEGTHKNGPEANLISLSRRRQFECLHLWLNPAGQVSAILRWFRTQYPLKPEHLWTYPHNALSCGGLLGKSIKTIHQRDFTCCHPEALRRRSGEHTHHKLCGLTQTIWVTPKISVLMKSAVQLLLTNINAHSRLAGFS